MAKLGLRRHWALAAAACLVVVAARVPFFWGNPDWGPLWGNEQCFLLSAPEIYANRQAADPQSKVPFHLVNPYQFKLHYHGGTVVLGRALDLLSRIFDTRSLALLKAIGTFYTALFAGLLALAWQRIYGEQGRAGLITAIFLISFSPFFFLWASLTPLGHYLESHVFFGLFLPFYARLAHKDLGRGDLVGAGLLAGATFFYVFSNAIFFAVLLGAYLVRFGRPVKARWIGAALSVASCLAVTIVLGRPMAIVTRFLSSGVWMKEGELDAGAAEPWEPLASVAGRYVDTLLGYFGTLDAAIPGWGLEPLATVAVGVTLLLGAGFLLYHVPVPVRARASTAASARQRFFAYNGWLMCAFGLAYVVFDPDVGDPASMSAPWYLAPVFPIVFVGCAGFVQRALAFPRRIVRLGTGAVALVVGGLLTLGWYGAVAADTSDEQRPGLEWCDSTSIHGYFWEVEQIQPDSGDDPPPYSPTAGFEIDRVGGEARCKSAHPLNGGSCEGAAYYTALSFGSDETLCFQGSTEQRDLCARALGAIRYAADGCVGLGRPLEDACEEFEGPQREACLSGAAQGSSLDFSSRWCKNALAHQCEDTFPRGRRLSTCLEQIVALGGDAPQLSPPPADTPAECAAWPRLWKGLCSAAILRADAEPESVAPESCEDVHAERFADALPLTGDLAYDECLVSSPAYYPWCAIGVARGRGETDCQWSDDDAPR